MQLKWGEIPREGISLVLRLWYGAYTYDLA